MTPDTLKTARQHYEGMLAQVQARNAAVEAARKSLRVVCETVEPLLTEYRATLTVVQGDKRE